MTLATKTHKPLLHLEFEGMERTNGAQLAAQKIARDKKLGMLQERHDLFREEAARLNRRLKNGSLSIADWREAMMDLTKDIHISAYVSGKSGEWESMSFKDWGHVGRTLRDQYGFIRRWARELEGFAGDEKALENVSLAKLNQRANLYAEAASQSFERGYSSEVGIDPSVLPAWPGDGTTECYSNCRCRWRIRILSKSRGDFNASWTLGSAEHCRTCRERARKWKQLKIRGNRLVDGYEPIYD